MKNHEIYKRRIQQFIDRIYGMRYSDPVALEASFFYHKNVPIPYEAAIKAKYKRINVGAKWGNLWGCSWFKFQGSVPETHEGKEVVALIDVDGEGCIFKDGTPYREPGKERAEGFTPRGSRCKRPLWRHAKIQAG